ncbi:MAG: type II toxin-antitoxin system HicA family toxin [Phycisphaeraceae bacterium]
MTRLPRDLNGREPARALSKPGYRIIRQTGSHIRLTCPNPAEHHITIPDHRPIKPGTLAAILRSIAEHHHLSREQLIERLFA